MVLDFQIIYGIDLTTKVLKSHTGRWLRWMISGLIGDEKSRAYFLMQETIKADSAEDEDEEDVHLPSYVPIA
jgi:hypothetical protein